MAKFQFGWTPNRSAGYVIGNNVILNLDRWNKRDSAEKLQLLAHELAHVAQYQSMSHLGFLARRAREPTDWYQVDSRDLRGVAYESITLDDGRGTLEDVAFRVEEELARRLGL